MSNILPGKASARSWKRAVGTGKLSPFACLLPQSAGERSQEQEETWGWGQGKQTQMKPVELAGVIPGARERGGRCCVAGQETARRHRLGEAAQGPPLERGWKPEPG